MKLTQKTIAALALPEGKSETIAFDEDCLALVFASAPAAVANSSTSIKSPRRTGKLRSAR